MASSLVNPSPSTLVSPLLCSQKTQTSCGRSRSLLLSVANEVYHIGTLIVSFSGVGDLIFHLLASGVWLLEERPSSYPSQCPRHLMHLWHPGLLSSHFTCRLLSSNVLAATNGGGGVVDVIVHLLAYASEPGTRGNLCGATYKLCIRFGPWPPWHGLLGAGFRAQMSMSRLGQYPSSLPCWPCCQALNGRWSMDDLHFWL